MKLTLAVMIVISVLFLASCVIQPQPAGPPDQPLMPPALDVEIDTAPAATSTPVYHLVLENGNLMPVDVEINTGDTIEWINKDAVRYTLLFSGSEERLPVGGTFEQRFTESGIVRYIAAVVEEDQEDEGELELQGIIIVN